MSKKKGKADVIEVQEVVAADPLNARINAQHVVEVLQQKYPSIFDACVAQAKYLVQEQVARQVVAEKDARIAELEAKLDGKAAVKEADTIVQNGVTS